MLCSFTDRLRACGRGGEAGVHLLGLAEAPDVRITQLSLELGLVPLQQQVRVLEGQRVRAHG